MTNIEQRIAKLERQAHRYRQAFFGVCLVAVAAITIAAVPQTRDIKADRVTCNSLSIKNDEGQTVVSIGTRLNGGWLTIRNSDGQRLAMISGFLDSGYLSIYNNNDQAMASLGTSETGGVLYIYNNTGEPVVQIYADDTGTGFVGAFDPKGKGKTLEPR